MAFPNSFIQAWRAWRHCPAPYENSRLRRFNEPSYEVEVDLDHLNSDLSMWGYFIFGGSDFDYPKRALDELSRVSEFRQTIEALALTEERKEHFRKYFEVTETLLREIVKLRGSGRAPE